MLVLILPSYKTLLILKKLINRFYAPQKSRHKIIHPFSRRYLTHLIIIVVSVFTMAANLNAYETRRDDFNQTSVIASLITAEDLGSIEEQGPITSEQKAVKYLGSTGVETQPHVTEGLNAEELIPSIVAGDSAVVSPILSPVEEGLRQRDQIITYTVQSGDTVSQIAEQFGITVNTLLWENNLTSYSLIRPGDRLTILPTSGIRHKVKSGETIAKLSSTYGVEAEKIISFNKLVSADDINIGETLMIPGGKKVVPAASTYTVRAFTQPAVTPTPAPRVISASGEMVWPTSCRRITQYFRYLHSGVDIACPLGTPIYASDNGVVTKAQSGWNGGYGTMVTIDHGNGKETLYGHLSAFYVQVGEEVEKGQSIAAMGSTGRSTGSHVHFEVRTGGSRQNPLYYVK